MARIYVGMLCRHFVVSRCDARHLTFKQDSDACVTVDSSTVGFVTEYRIVQCPKCEGSAMTDL